MASKDELVWYFAYGSNMSSAKFTGSRGIVPLESARVRLPGFVLAMEIPGLPYSEPSFATIAPQSQTDAEKGARPDVLGVAYLIRAHQYEHVIASEGGGTAYNDIRVFCEPLDLEDRERWGDRVEMRTLGTAILRRPAPTPSKRYMKIVTEGSKEAGLPLSYQQYLLDIPVYEPPESSRTRLGASIFNIIWGPVMLAMERITNKSIQKDGNAHWAVIILRGHLKNMSAAKRNGMSQRGWSNVEAIMPKIKGAVEERKIKENPNIDLSTAENWLIREELIEICKESIARGLEPKHFSYPRGFAGDPDLLDALSAFFNNYFAPHSPVLATHLATAPGATACIDTLLYNICEPGDGILMSSPYWNGFDFGIRVRSSVNPVLVTVDSHGDNFSDKLLPALERAYHSASCPIKALMITNPQNPLSVCYPRKVLEQCLQFCAKAKIHFISDEVYALSTFPSPDLADPEPFVSVLSLDLDTIGIDKSYVHMVWSTSKDFGQSGLRLGCTISQSNQEMAVGLALAANTQLSALTTIFVTSLLTSPELPRLIALNSQRLAHAYGKLTEFLRDQGIPYHPCNAGLYIYVKIAPRATTWEDEAQVVSKLKSEGVLVSSGRAYHGPESEKGWARVGFAVQEHQLQEAIRRMGRVFGRETQNGIM